MAFDYNSRTSWEKGKVEAWEKAHKKQISRIEKNNKEIYEEVLNFSDYPHCGFPRIKKLGREKLKGDTRSLKEFMLQEYGDFVDLFVPDRYREDYEYLLDQYVSFQYSRSLFRPTIRTADPSAHLVDAFGLLQAYKVLGIFGTTPVQYMIAQAGGADQSVQAGGAGHSALAGGGIQAGGAEGADSGAADAETADFIKSDTYARKLHMIQFDDILAARIDRGDAAVIDAVREALLSDNNTVLVTVPLIRGIVKSRNTELHDLLAKFLLAARLQEGVRQAVCENADCGRAEAFLTILQTIEDNDLLRFSAVKRAIATWTGICSVDAMDRVSAKLLAGISGAVRDREQALEMTRTDDSVQIVTGLWAIGFYEARDAIKRMLEIAENGTQNQRLAISYYNHYMQFSEYSEQAARKILETYPEDLRMAAAFMPTYLDAVDTIVRSCIHDSKGKVVYSVDEDDLVFVPLPVTEIFEDADQARRHYQILKNLADSMKKRKMEFSPLIFPWYGVVLDKSGLTQRMAMIAYALQDQDLIDEICVRLTDIMDSYYNTRKNYLRVLLHDPQTKVQKDALIGYVADKESFTRKAAWQLLKKLPLTEGDYMQLEKHLRLKNEETRHYVIDLLEQQEKAEVDESIKRLLGSGKEQLRLAGLDMLKRRSEEGEEAKSAAAALLREVLPDGEDLSDKEKVLYEEIASSEGAGSILNTEGYGLYDTSAEYTPDLTDIRKDIEKLADQYQKKSAAGFLAKITGRGPDAPQRLLQNYFCLSAAELDGYFDRIRAFVLDHGKLEYTTAAGEKQLLEDGLCATKYEYSDATETRYPFPELWEEVYETIIREPQVFFNLYFASIPGYDATTVLDMNAYIKADKTVFGAAGAGYHYTDPKFNSTRSMHTLYSTLLDIIASQQHLVLPQEVARAALLQAISLPEEIRWLKKAPSKYGSLYDKKYPHVCYLRSNKFRAMMSRASRYENEQEFRDVFPLLYQADRVYELEQHIPSMSYYASSNDILDIYPYVEACKLGMISRDFLYKAVFDMIGLKNAVADLGRLFKPVLVRTTLNCVRGFAPVDYEKHTIDQESGYYRLCDEVYRNLVNLILNVELKRGDTPTVFSGAVSGISRVEGIPRLMEILRAMGKDPLDRGTYYSFNNGTSKKECLSHLIKVCYPVPGTETAEDLKKAVKAAKVSQDRLIEVAMYAPQWMEMTEQVLGMEGFTSGCYYFMAHMNERFDDRRKAMIARYTPLSAEELNNGCFDTGWFFEVYQQLGEKNFARLYKAAKYIADGSKHTRARKYADAATGKVDRDELEKVIEDKRNKDLLMSYGLIPMKDIQDSLHRYEFLQKFLKESKKYGAQRRQSEAKAVEYALKNMATTAGYSDELRLTLAMETELVNSSRKFFDGVVIGDYTAQIQVEPDGKSSLVLMKKGKTIKSVPAALKKDEAFIEIKEFAAKLKSQYSRCVAMFERAMEEEEVYSLGELNGLCANPVTAGILNRLVFVGAEAEEKDGSADGSVNGNANESPDGSVNGNADGSADGSANGNADGSADGSVNGNADGSMKGAIPAGTLEELNSEASRLPADTRLLVAHPSTLRKVGLLAVYQRLFFEKQKETGLKQPFKQVFREFYVKLEEEKDALDSRMFAGYQIQPKKTVAALKGRRWVADYDEGLQKIFFRQDITATIYALADWFSPADTESPTLEFVSFYDRKTHKQKKLKEVPDILYSEVMRDVDLAVSVAHVGGVDPETSHSTIEMRRAIFAFNMELFGITNVTFEGTHAFIKGTLDNYSVQLGSGVIHKESGGMVNILPVHSQQRGKIFLPFIDEDPKTAEILSKILLLAEDQKIKDPYILEQLR